ncbi:MAG: GTPase RsgA, partial [Pseudomonadales bacterium]
MAKRKLSKQQRTRVENQQRAAQDAEGQQRGLVIANFGKQAAVEGMDEQQITRCDVRPKIDSLVAGDRISWQKKADGGLVTSLLPRTNQLARPDSRGQLKPVAANIDHAVLVIATQPQPFSNLIDRYLAAIELSNIQPLL